MEKSKTSNGNGLRAPEESDYDRLEDQIAWYDQMSQGAQSWYKRLRLTQIIISALVPISALVNFGAGAILPGVLGAIVLVVEGAQELGAYQRNWTRYRATCEMLRHEKYLYLAGAGPYDGISRNDAKKELALRVEALVSEEHSHWLTHMEATKARAKERTEAGSVGSQRA